MNNNFPTDPMNDLDARRAWDVVDYCDLIVANALRAPSLSSASPIEPKEVSTKGFNRLSQGGGK
jgi:hypothetical protein